jgi:hypothetical protein
VKVVSGVSGSPTVSTLGPALSWILLCGLLAWMPCAAILSSCRSHLNRTFCTVCSWDARTRKCHRASLLVFAVARPVDITEKGVGKRDAKVTEVPEASWIYKYGAKKAADIGIARWIAQVRRLPTCIMAAQ